MTEEGYHPDLLPVPNTAPHTPRIDIATALDVVFKGYSIISENKLDSNQTTLILKQTNDIIRFVKHDHYTSIFGHLIGGE